MAGRIVDTEAMGQAVEALDIYINEMRENIQKIQDAAIDCADNMENDVYSKNAIYNLQDCITELYKTIAEAEELKRRIRGKMQQLEESRSF